MLSLLAILSALALGVALFVVTRDDDLPVALAGLAGRVAEGIMGVVYVLPTLAFISAAEVLREVRTGSEAVLVVDLLVSVRETAVIFSATCFAAGSTAFSFLLLRSRAIPVALGWLGLLASALLLIAQPILLGVGGRGQLVLWIWLPMLVFEFALSAWLLAKGVQPIVVEAGPPP